MKSHSLTPAIVWASVVLLFIVAVLFLTVSYARMNWKEIETLVDRAQEQGKNYELIVHNDWLNTYSFQITD